MKKNLLFAVAMIFAGTASSQLTVGALAGPNLSIVSQSLSEDVEGFEAENASGVGFQLGAFAKYGLSDKLGIKAELQFQSRVQSDNDSETIAGQTSEFKYKSRDSFLAIPILVDLELTDGLSLEVGPSLGFLMGSRITTESTIGGQTTEITIDGSDATEGVNKLEFGVAIGAHYMINEDLGLGFRYTRALSDVFEDNDLGGDVTLNTNYNVIQLNITYNLFGE